MACSVLKLLRARGDRLAVLLWLTLPSRTVGSFPTLSGPSLHGTIAGSATLFLICIAVIACSCICCCCYWKRRRRQTRNVLYLPYDKAVHVNITSPTEYHCLVDGSGQEKVGERKVSPFFVGPEHFTTYASPSSFKDRLTQSVPSPQKSSRGTVGYSKLNGVDTTLVNYAEVLQNDDALVGSFEPPSSNDKDIYAQLENCGSKSIKRSDLQIRENDGNKGTWRAEGKASIRVHLKRSGAQDKMIFLQEAATLAQFKHSNVITFYGILVDDLQVTIVEEMLCGNLKSYLNRLRAPLLNQSPGVSVSRVTPRFLLNFSQQVSLGMKYLAEKGIVHGKLMASSIMLSRTNTCKITDFGWSRAIASGNVHGIDIPTKWNAPEVVSYSRFSNASDVWSYGCLLYEIWSLGRDPMEGESNINVNELITVGWRLAPPPGCPKVIYELMMESWSPEPDERPSFAQLVTDLTRLEALVLNIPQKLLDKHPLCGELGGTLNIGKLMYRSIQVMYAKSAEKAFEA